MKNIFTTLIIIFIFVSSSIAVDLTDTEAVKMALDHSFQLKKAESESEAYRANLNATQSERYPTLSFEAKALYNSNISQLDLAIPGFSLQKDIGLHEIFQTDLKLAVPLYTGGKISSSINLAEANLQIREALNQKSNDEIRFLAQQEYLKLYKFDNLLEAAQSSLIRTELVKKDIHSLHQVGMADSVQLNEIELSYNKAILAVEQSSINRRRQEIILTILLGLDTDESIRISTPPHSPQEMDKTEITIAEDKPELQTARSMIRVNESLLKFNRSAYSPNLNLFTGYSYGKPNISPFEEEFNGNFSFGASLVWSLNLGGKTKSKVSMAKHQLESSHQEYNRVQEQFSQQAKIAYENLKLTFASYKTSLKTFEISKENFRLAQIKYREGIMSANHLLDIETNLSQAESMIYSSEADYHLTLNQFYYITGYENNKEGK